ncbi:Uncharacterized protein YrbN [Buchnera aphidicola (Periphyllus testudinaceus)]
MNIIKIFIINYVDWPLRSLNEVHVLHDFDKK